MMIRQLSGTVSGNAANSVIINVQGVGYFVHTSVPGTQFPIGSEITLHTHLAVRENALDLYGFQLQDELEAFELLITLPKIGPKSAQQILTQADIALLKEAVRNDDPVYLSKMSGIGKKSAEKIVIGLKDKFELIGVANEIDGTNETGAGGAIPYASDTIDALIALGYPPNDARKVVQKLSPEITNANDAVREALRLLSN
ncbi:Holliday junction branch migration protein RuvA [Candidatus Pacebacteria bacterium]|nr:Holliday junction branch migration protein RuvA [Candidatus Paceibacterota bacterium]